ncbi:MULTISPECIES: ATP-dependent nuclease [Pseudomonas]|uniref:ATP-dependent nuclease n=1 Tax=Pseudomonas TaxID=286 RepID=UPI0002A32B6F|nr:MULTISPECIES: AAA family ATPase [Pseudomonas]NTX91232.1 ATP-binding protein [Pseudomonas sp. UMA643]NTY17831.1 ATP-binding protein [Pseudomonas sp. UMC3103]NTY24750.1 ATP-binding protein [Pseudomonas sp. UMA603]NTY32167.1 ATP-binding protein [Pseudomonas sp. UMC3129]NTY55814.1 ATP-binding protein [Pseudomonas sp. UMC631]
MKIIKKVEIRYFRSVYSVDLKDLNDLNILVGGNDSGKSNLLKALNLFFNNKTEITQDFYFLDDLTRKREQEARDAKGRATIWVKVHFMNFLDWKSLPQEFSIKKVWNRYSDQPETIYPKGLPITAIARFLNKISFHYIPAIRGRDIFSHFLTLLHDALLEDEKAGLIDSTIDLMNVLNENTLEMSDQIKRGVGIDSNIQPPTNLRVLFNALDFSTEYSGYNVPLQKRGDGIQSRHIPYILDFIAKHTKTHHIWAYEEPETSLELGPAFDLAKQFSEEFCVENQVFLTTHSPAFYDLSGPLTSKWYVSQEMREHGVETIVEEVSSQDLVDRKLGVAALVAVRAKEAFEQIESLKSTVIRLDEELLQHNIPHIIVEGVTDKDIMDIAFQKLFPGEQPFFEILYADGATNIPPYLKSAKLLSKELPHPVIGIFDRDQEGRKQIKEFSDATPIDQTDFLEVSHDRRVYVGLLPLPAGFDEIQSNINMELGGSISLPVPIEFMFPSRVIARALAEEVIELENRIAKANDPELPATINLSELFSAQLPAEYSYLSKKVKKSSKKRFSRWISNQPAESFESFTILFEQLRLVIELDMQS